MNRRLLLAILLPFLALALQWLLWPWIASFVWFLFFPTVFFSARLGGLWAGLLATMLSAGMVWYFFIPPRLSWAVNNPANLYSVGMFLVKERKRAADKSFVRKPVDFAEFAETVARLGVYWLATNEPPCGC